MDSWWLSKGGLIWAAGSPREKKGIHGLSDSKIDGEDYDDELKSHPFSVHFSD